MNQYTVAAEVLAIQLEFQQGKLTAEETALRVSAKIEAYAEKRVLEALGVKPMIQPQATGKE